MNVTLNPSSVLKIVDRVVGAYFDKTKEKRKIQEKLQIAIGKENVEEVKSILAMYSHVLTHEQHNNAVIWVAEKEGLYSEERPAATEIEDICSR
jgi:hypothetical protein